jgi:hypothetical protein
MVNDISSTVNQSVMRESQVKSTAKSCFRCESKEHLVSRCPQKDYKQSNRDRPMPNRAVNNQYRPQPQARVNACVTETARDADATSPPAAVNCCVSVPPNVTVSSTPIGSCNAVPPPITGTDCLTVNGVGVSVSKVAHDVNLAQLNYVNINIEGMNQCVRALADGGAELSVINAELLRDLEYVPLGKVCLRGIVGNPVFADIANLRIRLSVNDEDEFVSTMFAVCSDANEECILTDDVVNRLYDI